MKPYLARRKGPMGSSLIYIVIWCGCKNSGTIWSCLSKEGIINRTIGVTFAKVVVFEKGGEDVNWAFYVVQMQSIGTRGHKGKRVM